MEIEWQRAGAYVVCRDAAGRILLTLFELDGNAHSGSWTLPGGGMEWGEQAADTALRELGEETGLVATIGPLLGVRSEWFNAHELMRGRPGHGFAVVFAATDVAGELKTDFDDDDTTIDARWFSLAEVAELKRVGLVDFALDLASGSMD